MTSCGERLHRPAKLLFHVLPNRTKFAALVAIAFALYANREEVQLMPDEQ